MTGPTAAKILATPTGSHTNWIPKRQTNYYRNPYRQKNAAKQQVTKLSATYKRLKSLVF